MSTVSWIMTTVMKTSVRTEVSALMPSTDTRVSVQRDTGEQELRTDHMIFQNKLSTFVLGYWLLLLHLFSPPINHAQHIIYSMW